MTLRNACGITATFHVSREREKEKERETEREGGKAFEQCNSMNLNTHIPVKKFFAIFRGAFRGY